MSSFEHTQQVENWIDEIKKGDSNAREQLINCACDRLMNLTRYIKKGFNQVNRWEQTDDVFQRATLRLYKSLEQVELQDARHFFRLAATQIRRELIDLTRHYSGPQGMGKNHATQMVNTSESAPHGAYDAAAGEIDAEGLNEWSEFHDQIEKLPQEQREVVELLFYNGLSQEEAAEVMGVNVRTVKRYWRNAKIALHEMFDGELPGMP